MLNAALVVSVFVLGGVIGAVILLRWWLWYTAKPENARKMLKGAYRAAHPHWLQEAPDLSGRVCPCCGWSETEALMQKAPPITLAGYGIKQISVKWMTVDGKTPLVGPRAEMEATAKHFRESISPMDGDHLDYQVRPYERLNLN